MSRCPARLLAFCLVLSGCGADEAGEDFTPCGGNIISGWDFASATFPTGGDTCPDQSIGGFIFFNDNGRYSLSANIKSWKQQPSDASCGFASAYGGFYRVEGSRVCLSGSGADPTSIPCDQTDGDPLWATAEYCVAGDRLTLSSSNLLNLRFSALLELTRKP